MRTSLLGDHFLLIIPKSDKVLQYHPWMKGLTHENKGNDQQLTIESSWWFYKFSLLGPRECLENSMENIHNDVGCNGLINLVTFMFESGVMLLVTCTLYM